MTRRVPVVFLIACVTAVASAQPRVSELEGQLPSLSGVERAKALTELTALLNNDAPQRAIAYGDEALAWYEAHPDPAQEARTLAMIAWAYMIVSDYPKAIASAERGRDLARQHGDDEGLADSLNSLGVIAQRHGVRCSTRSIVLTGSARAAAPRQAGRHRERARQPRLRVLHGLPDYDRALAYQLEGLKIRETLGDNAAIALSLNNIGIIYDRTGDSDKALEYFQQALDLRRNSGAKNRIASTLSNMGDVYAERGEYAQALDAQQQVLALRREVGDTGGIAGSLRSIGEIQLETGDYAAARRNLEEALHSADATGDKGTAGRALLGLSRAAREQGHGQDAQAYAKRALAIAEETSARELRRQALGELAADQESVGDFAAALSSFKRFKQENDRIFDQDKAKRLELLERRYQSEKHEKEIMQLRRGEADRALDVARQRLLRNFVAGTGLLSAVVAFGLFRRRIESARLAEQLSVTDALTGLKNRRYVLQTIGADLATVHRRRRGTPPGEHPVDADITFLMIDIDRFKSVNDEFVPQRRSAGTVAGVCGRARVGRAIALGR